MNAPQYAHEEQLRAQMAMRVAQNLTADGFSSYGNL
jgi:hypothetical protein